MKCINADMMFAICHISAFLNKRTSE